MEFFQVLLNRNADDKSIRNGRDNNNISGFSLLLASKSLTHCFTLAVSLFPATIAR